MSKSSKAVAKLKMKRAMKKHRDGVPMSKALMEEGYSKNVAYGGTLRKTKSWQEAFNEVFPDSEVVRLHKEIADYKNLTTKKFEGITDVAFVRRMLETDSSLQVMDVRLERDDLNDSAYVVATYFAPDKAYRSRALDMAYKVKGRYIEKKELSLGSGWDGASDEELDSARAEIDNELKMIKERWEQHAKDKVRSGDGEQDKRVGTKKKGTGSNKGSKNRKGKV